MPGRNYSSSVDKYRYGFNGKENVDEIKGSGNSVDFGDRYNDTRLGRWFSVDKLAGKYPEISPYVFGIDNPIYIIDFDGNDIIPCHITDFQNFTGTVYKYGEVSAKTEAAFRDIMKTNAGLAFLSQFAKKGQTFAGHTFTADGIYSNHDLYINDYSLEDYEGLYPSNVLGNFGPVYNDSKKNLKFTLNINSQRRSKESIGETIVHESTLHDKIKMFVNAYKDGGKEGFNKVLQKEKTENPDGGKEHQSFKKHDSNNPNYKKYVIQLDELIKVDPKYKDAGKTADSNAQKQY